MRAATGSNAGGDLVRARVATPLAHGGGVASGRDREDEHNQRDHGAAKM